MSKKPAIEELKQQIAELTQALQRERADSINLRARAEKDRQTMGDFYKVLILREFLPVIDNLDTALKHAPKDLKDHSYVKGVQAVAQQFEKALRELGVERIKTVGEKFDPHLHEAVHLDEGSGTRSTGSGQEHEIVTEEVQAGYKMGNEVIRHAVVKVRKEKK